MSTMLTQATSVPENYDNVIVRHPTYLQVPDLLCDAYTIISDGVTMDYEEWGEAQAPHYEASQEAILATARVALERTDTPREASALVLGPGHCRDIPLEEIASSFGRTVLIGLPMTDTQKVVEQLPLSLQQKIDLVAADLTGMSGKLMTPLIGALKRHSRFHELYKAAMPILRNVEANAYQVPDFGANCYAFVCSQLVATQLGGAPEELFNEWVNVKYHIDMERTTARRGRALAHAWQDVNTSLQIAHVKQLSRLVTQTGTVHFANTLAPIDDLEIVVSSAPLQRDVVQEEIDTHFTPLTPPRGWSWTVNEKYHYPVIAQALMPVSY